MSRFYRAVLVFVLASTSLAGSPSESFSVMHFKESRPLELKRDRVAFLGDEASIRAATDAMVSRASSAEATAVRGVTRVMLGEPIRDLRAELAHLSALAPPGVLVSPVFVDDLGGDLIPTGAILAGFEERVGDARARAMLTAMFPGATVSKPWASFGTMYRIDTEFETGLEVLEGANRLAQIDGVAFAEPDMMFSGSGMHTPNDPDYFLCWGHENVGQFGGSAGEDMNTNEAWDITFGSPDVRVVVIDTGVDLAHPDLTLYHTGFDTTSDNGDGNPLNPFDNHGTPVAGCVAATIDNALGTVGVAPACEVISVRPFIGINSSGNWSSCNSWTVAALQIALDEGALVTNNSNRYGFPSSAITNAYGFTRNLGVVHFASAGNESAGSATFPASAAFVNSVAALDQSGFPTDFTNSDLNMAFSAPGIDVYTTDRSGSDGWSSGDYTFAYGTSFASPYVAGVAALVRSIDPTLTPAEVEGVLQATARDYGLPGQDRDYGHGFIDAGAAVREVFVCPGDCAADGAVDFNDLVCILFRFGQQNPSGQTDCDGSGAVDFNDLVCALFAFGPCF